MRSNMNSNFTKKLINNLLFLLPKITQYFAVSLYQQGRPTAFEPHRGPATNLFGLW